ISKILLMNNKFLDLHNLAVIGVKGADHGFCHHMLLVLPVAPAHLHDSSPLRVWTDAALGEFHHFAVVDRNESRRSPEVRLPQPTPGHVFVVGGVAEISPGELERRRAARDALTT